MCDVRKAKRLIMVEANNCKTGAQNNKFYNMEANASGTSFTVKYGRIGSTVAERSYPIGQWESKLKEKLKKGYVDNTDLFLEKENKSEYKAIKENKIRNIVEELQRYANASISENYIVGTNSVTEKQIARVQELINELVNETRDIKTKSQIDSVNSLLLEVFRVIPRKMIDVRKHLIPTENIGSNDELMEIVNRTIANEQNTLDVMQGQVKVLDSTSDDQDILEAMGVSIFGVDEKEIEMIKKLLGDCKGRFVEAFNVINKKTQERFDKFVSSAEVKRTKLFWHGSRNENWWSILDNGLLLRPSNVVITGKMFGQGEYGADEAKKSLGYTSLSGSYWARGRSSVGFMSLFNFHLGNSLKITSYNNWMGDLNEKRLKARGPYDSVFAQKGNGFLYNNEYIVYNEAQSTIKYLVKLNS